MFGLLVTGLATLFFLWNAGHIMAGHFFGFGPVKVAAEFETSLILSLSNVAIGLLSGSCFAALGPLRREIS